LVLSTGYFGDGFADCFETYGAKVTKLTGPVGGRPQLPEIEKALKSKKFKVITVTHVDTSTGVLSELENLSKLVKSVSPETLLIVDGVCSVACEEIAFDAWKLDGVVTASQKAIGCPAGLSISMFSGKAIEAFQARKSPPASYFASFKNWIPIMKNYEAKKPSYFATPSPQLIHALNTSLTQILARPLSERFAKHREVSDKIKKTVADLGLKQVAANPEDQAHGMTAIYLPETVKTTELLPKLAKAGVIWAGGIHKEIATKYVRFGHMGVSVVSLALLRFIISAWELRLTDCDRRILLEVISTRLSRPCRTVLRTWGTKGYNARRPESLAEKVRKTLENLVYNWKSLERTVNHRYGHNENEDIHPNVGEEGLAGVHVLHVSEMCFQSVPASYRHLPFRTV
jgi:aspartate aminotransferase-like enzyme